MGRGLIGFTGFVGSNLDGQSRFEEKYNSKNIDEIRGKHFDELYCAGISAVKWWANKHPTEDLEGIVRLLDPLLTVKAERFVLISTVDVYGTPSGVDESHPITTAGLHPYGTHRRIVENVVMERFPVHHVIRLPGLVGRGLKKNFVYDLVVGKPVDGVHCETEFQFYHLDHLSADIGKAVDHGLSEVNFATEPVSAAEVARAAFDLEFDNRTERPPAKYDMRTRHASIFGASGPYLASKAEVLKQVTEFVAGERGGQS